MTEPKIDLCSPASFYNLLPLFHATSQTRPMEVMSRASHTRIHQQRGQFPALRDKKVYSLTFMGDIIRLQITYSAQKIPKKRKFTHVNILFRKKKQKLQYSNLAMYSFYLPYHEHILLLLNILLKHSIQWVYIPTYVCTIIYNDKNKSVETNEIVGGLVK